MDFTTAYARRRKYPDFADQWDGALMTHRSLLERAEEEALRSLDDTPPPTPPHQGEGSLGAPTPTHQGEGSIGVPQTKRIHAARWTEAKERKFFDELVASANVRRAAEAAGVSPQAVYARRAKSVSFRMRWAQALANGRAAIEMSLVAEARRSMDPDEMDLPVPEPRVSVSEAIKISQISQSGGRGRSVSGAFEQDEEAAEAQAMEELRARLQRKIEALRARMLREEGYTLDPDTDEIIPPGYIRDPNYVPKGSG